MQKDLEAGIPVKEAIKKHTLSSNTWTAFKGMRAGKDYDPGLIEAPEIVTHNLDSLQSSAWGKSGYAKKPKSRSQKCIVVLTEASNLRDVIEGLL